MKQLQIALVVKNKPNSFRRDDRPMGYWSYPVPEFEWNHFTLGKGFIHDTRQWKKQGFDLVFHEDGGNYGKYVGPLPIVYMAIDSTLTPEHYESRLGQAKNADLVLVDHDRLDRFKVGKTTRRLNYCVNDGVFRDYGLPKNADVAFHCNTTGPGGQERGRWKEILRRHCDERGYVFRTGLLGNPEYAYSFNSARITVNVPRTELNRPHRIFDAMACRGCVLTAPIPVIEGDEILENYDFAQADSPEQMLRQIDSLLEYGHWQSIADNGYRVVMANHTWAIRAKELRTMLAQEFGL